MTKTILSISIILLLFSCSFREELDKNMEFGKSILADKEFKNAIALIELHKTRYGDYPESLSELKHISVMDESIANAVQYDKLDSGYELNIVMEFPNFNNKSEAVQLEYPEEFWEGLGCVSSNTMSK